MLESVMGQYLQWRLMVPTASEYIKQLLFFANNDVDFEEVINMANQYSLIAYFVYEISFYMPSTIALAALFLSLERMQYFGFA